jgi:hypothetical protein
LIRRAFCSANPLASFPAGYTAVDPGLKLDVWGWAVAHRWPSGERAEKKRSGGVGCLAPGVMVEHRGEVVNRPGNETE